MPGSGMSATRAPVALSCTCSTGLLPQPSTEKSSVLVANMAGRVRAPVTGIVFPLSAGWFVMASGVSPPGTIHRWSPAFMSIAVIRLYGGFRMGSPCAFGTRALPMIQRMSLLAESLTRPQTAGFVNEPT